MLTLVDNRTNLARQSAETIRESYGSAMRIFDMSIPVAVKAAETSAYGRSIFAHDRTSPVAKAYSELAKEVVKHVERRRDSLQSAKCR